MAQALEMSVGLNLVVGYLVCSLVREATDGGGYDALVAAHDRALAAVSHDIAEALRVVASR